MSILADSAGALDEVDQWESLRNNGVEGGSSSPPRTEMLYNWDAYVLSSTLTKLWNQKFTLPSYFSSVRSAGFLFQLWR